MNIFLILTLLVIIYTLYTNKLENFIPTDLQKSHADKIFTFLNSSNRTYINYLTFLNDQNIPEPKLFNTDVYNSLNNAIQNKTLTLDNLDIIYNNL